MKLRFILPAVFLSLAASLCVAQAPSGTTGQCKDGTYSNAKSKDGACRGHKGVQSWYAATAATPTVPATAASAPAPAVRTAPIPAAPQPGPAAPAPAPRASKASQSTMAQAPGGGPGMVWVNLSSKVYHCPGTSYYGKTKNGKYMTEAAASSMGARPDAGKTCPK
jgi:hypothetical protein